MIIEEVQINNIIRQIDNICHNSNILNHLKRLIKENIDSILFIDDKSISAKKYDEEFEVNISDNYFNIYSTSWGHTVRKKISFFKYNNDLTMIFNNDEITEEGIISQLYIYKFSNEKLKQTSYSKKVNLEYMIGRGKKEIHNEESIEIYPINNNKALKVITINGIEKAYITDIKNIEPENVDIFTFINSRMNQKIDNDKSKRLLIDRRYV